MRELINITTYPVPHNNGTGGGGKTFVTYNGNTGINNSSANSGRMNFNSVNGGEGQFTYILGGEGTILKLSGDELNYNFGYIGELESDKITTGQLKADDADILKAWIETLDSKKITTEYLTVTKQAHFFELIIDKVRAVGGQIILTPAQCVADIVIARDLNGNVVNLYNSDGTLVGNIASLLSGTVKYFDVYFRNEDELGHGIDNEWVEHDQAFCQSFNVTEGVHHDIANKYYWRHVDAVLPNKMVNFTTKELKDVGDTLTSTNNIKIVMAQTKGESLVNGITWQATAQNIQGIQSTVQWNDISGSSNAIDGVMKTDSTALGIEIKPTSDNKYFMTKELTFKMNYSDTSIAPEGMKVGVYYTDGTSQYFSNLTFDGNCMTKLQLDCDHPIEAIVVVCTQPVQWHQCHAIRLSNTNMDEMLSPKASIPEPGDSIVQLGYQATGPDDPNAEVDGYSRQSAIIIAAYHTPDHELTAPSYAQYMGINDYHLSTHRGSYIDGKGAEFLGDIRLAKVAYDENGNAINMSEFVLDEKQIKTTVSELIITENNHYQENVTHITQNANAITLEAQRRENGDTTLQASINIQADRISTEVRDRQNADRDLSSSITQTASEIRTWVGQQDYANKTYVESQITQTAYRITTWVSNQNYATGQWVNSQIEQKADSITSWVRSQNYTTGDEVSSMISQSATSITAQVTENIEGKLIETGINIENKTITLKSDKIYFTPSSNNATWIQGITAGGSRVFALGQYDSERQPALYLPENPGGSGTICKMYAGYLQLGNGTMITADGSTSVFKMQTNNSKKFSITVNANGYVMIDGSNGHGGRRYLYVDGDGYLKLDDDAHVF